MNLSDVFFETTEEDFDFAESFFVCSKECCIGCPELRYDNETYYGHSKELGPPYCGVTLLPVEDYKLVDNKPMAKAI